MQQFRVWWNSFKTVAILISFIMNLVSLIALLLILMQIFQIKNGIAEPLIDGLHRNFVGLDEAVIERSIPVEDQIPVVFDLPLKQNTRVILTEDVPLAANASFTLPGGGGVINGRVNITLHKDLELPIALDMIVPVDTSVPVNLAVDVEIPLKETELHQPFANLRDLLEPYVRVIDNLPADWDEVPDFAVDAIQGEGQNLLSPSEDSMNPWPGPVTATPTGAPVLEQTRSGESANGDGLGATPTFTPFPTLTPSGTFPTNTPMPPESP